MNYLISFLLVSLFSAFGFKHTSNPVNESAAINPLEEEGVLYSSNSPRPDNATEFLLIAYKEDYSGIESIYYWTDMDPDRMKLIIHSQEFSEGEISGYTLEVSWPGNDEVIGLGLIEDRANLVFADGTFQEYEMGQN